MLEALDPILSGITPPKIKYSRAPIGASEAAVYVWDYSPPDFFRETNFRVIDDI